MLLAPHLPVVTGFLVGREYPSSKKIVGYKVANLVILVGHGCISSLLLNTVGKVYWNAFKILTLFFEKVFFLGKEAGIQQFVREIIANNDNLLSWPAVNQAVSQRRIIKAV
jgi:hypothetical protein